MPCGKSTGPAGRNHAAVKARRLAGYGRTCSAQVRMPARSGERCKTPAEENQSRGSLASYKQTAKKTKTKTRQIIPVRNQYLLSLHIVLPAVTNALPTTVPTSGSYRCTANNRANKNPPRRYHAGRLRLKDSLKPPQRLKEMNQTEKKTKPLPLSTVSVDHALPGIYHS